MFVCILISIIVSYIIIGCFVSVWIKAGACDAPRDLLVIGTVIWPFTIISFVIINVGITIVVFVSSIFNKIGQITQEKYRIKCIEQQIATEAEQEIEEFLRQRV